MSCGCGLEPQDTIVLGNLLVTEYKRASAQQAPEKNGANQQVHEQHCLQEQDNMGGSKMYVNTNSYPDWLE
eukprot:4688849-Amphidinium_carterae.1